MHTRLRLLLVILAVTGCCYGGRILAAGTVAVSFDLTRQEGFASNQYAVWIENSEGAVVKTLFATNFTAGRAGWKLRKESLPQWVQTADVQAMSQAQVDAFTGATPQSGRVTYTWNCDDATGNPVPPGVYTVLLEASLRQENRVVYQATVNLDGTPATATPQPRYFGEGTAERGMIDSVTVRYTP